MLDKIEITVRSGDGGDGMVAFRREKFVPRGGPNGGDGGRGGDVVIQTDSNLSHLSNFRYQKWFSAENGGNGRNNNKTGRSGANLVIEVPVGTVVSYQNPSFDEFSITDLDKPGACVVVAHGGRGGRGNARFVSSTNQAPRLAQKGELGEEKEITLELRLIADAGIIGYPNVGKSSLLAAASAARPKIADYPFTTLEPMLGLVEAERASFVIAEIPGLITGAHQGKGLGHEFLRHVLRTRVMVHLVDGSSASPVDDMIAVNNELFLFDAGLAARTQLVAVNKIDRPEVRERTLEIRELFRVAGVEVSFVSAATGEGVQGLMSKVAAALEQAPMPSAVTDSAALPIIRPQAHSREVEASRDGGVYRVTEHDLERLVAGSDTTNPEVRRQIGSILTRGRIRARLVKLGISPGDKVRVGAFEWTW
ncbi:MAG: GTPase ObgE [Dehalococcoidia bacterium]|nr:GTPase ObgE [Dehalococcoidia bacterium]